MQTTVYEIHETTGQRSWVWDSPAADMAHVEQAFSGLAHLHPGRVYEVEQDGQVILTLGR
jgi:hypothetical protein